MAKDIVMPKMGYDMTEGKLLHWIKHEGDTINKGEAIAEIETDKVNIEVEAFDTGVLQRILVQEGDTVPVGQPIGILSAPGEASPAEEKPQAKAPTAAAPSGPQPPEEKPGAGGGAIKQEPPSTTGVQAPERPQPRRQAEVKPPSQAPAGPHNGHAPGAAVQPGGRVKASPLARRLAQEYELDLSAIHGTGPGGRVTRDDVLSAAAAARTAAPAAPAPQPAAVPAPEAAPALAAAGEKSLSRLQQTMARRMVESKTQAPHFYLTVNVDMTAALALREQLNAEAEEGVRISVNDFIVKAAARALAKFPALNASYAGDKLTLHDEINVAVAVAIEEGLVTPVVRHADQKALGQISREVRELAERARGGKARLEDYEGGTFTVSNLGMYDIDTFVAIINPPQAAILAIGAVRRVPVFEKEALLPPGGGGDTLVPRERMSVTLSADHRVTDGARGALFLGEVRRYLENPLRLVM